MRGLEFKILGIRCLEFDMLGIQCDSYKVEDVKSRAF